MEKGPKQVDSYGASRAGAGESYVDNFPTETIPQYRKSGEIYVNEEVERMRNSGEWEKVRTDVALDEKGNIILGERAIFATPKKPA